MNKLTIEKWNKADPIECMDALNELPYTIFLDSNNSSHPLNNYSFIGWNPIEKITVKKNRIILNGNIIENRNLFSYLQKKTSEYNFENLPTELPFYGGLMGYFGYDLKNKTHHTEDEKDIPDATLGIYTNVLIFDHIKNESWIVFQDHKQKTLLEEKLKQKIELSHTAMSPVWSSCCNDKEYCNNIKHAIDLIYAGDVYQVNITRQFEAKTENGFNPFVHYKKLRKINAAPFSAYMNFDGLKISSCSPERFINLNKGTVETRPIKGTLPSHNKPEVLKNNPKERAENTMIVDLLRNDISKICKPHSVTVPSLCDIETFEGLHHMVSTVKGVLQNNKNAFDILDECLPGGSITGAPKISAMKVINDIETKKRNIYCGSIGYIGFNGNMDTNIVIRTLVYTRDKIYLNAGSGIVSDSIPEKELQETQSKAQKIFESFE